MALTLTMKIQTMMDTAMWLLNLIKLDLLFFYSKYIIQDGYEISKISGYLDAIHLMSYDMHGSWEPSVTHHSPLFGSDGDALTTDFA